MSIIVAGAPSNLGGADTELYHNIKLWVKNRIPVTIVPMYVMSSGMVTEMRELGVTIKTYSPEAFKGGTVVSFCNGEFLKKIEEIRPYAKKIVWFNCMTWTFPMEIKVMQKGLIDYVGFVSDYQEKWLSESYAKLGVSWKKFEGYQPYFDVDDSSFNLDRPTSTYNIGRLSRPDPAKYSKDMWRIFNRVNSPKPKKVFIQAWSDAVRSKVGLPPKGLDYICTHANKFSQQDFYHKLHTIIHKTGGSRESYCRIVPECYQYGTVMIAENDYAFPKLIINGVTGFVCDSSDEMSFRASELAFDGDKRKKIVKNAFDFLKSVISNKNIIHPWKLLLS